MTTRLLNGFFPFFPWSPDDVVLCVCARVQNARNIVDKKREKERERERERLVHESCCHCLFRWSERCLDLCVQTATRRRSTETKVHTHTHTQPMCLCGQSGFCLFVMLTPWSKTNKTTPRTLILHTDSVVIFRFVLQEKSFHKPNVWSSFLLLLRTLIEKVK